jgi:hypothetical protein
VLLVPLRFHIIPTRRGASLLCVRGPETSTFSGTEEQVLGLLLTLLRREFAEYSEFEIVIGEPEPASEPWPCPRPGAEP